MVLKLAPAGSLVWSKIGADGSPLFAKQCCTKGRDTSEGIAVAPDGTVLIAGTTTLLGDGFDTGGAVAAAAGDTVRLAATAPYSLLPASLKLVKPRLWYPCARSRQSAKGLELGWMLEVVGPSQRR